MLSLSMEPSDITVFVAKKWSNTGNFIWFSIIESLSSNKLRYLNFQSCMQKQPQIKASDFKHFTIRAILSSTLSSLPCMCACKGMQAHRYRRKTFFLCHFKCSHHLCVLPWAPRFLSLSLLLRIAWHFICCLRTSSQLPIFPCLLFLSSHSQRTPWPVPLLSYHAVYTLYCLISFAYTEIVCIMFNSPVLRSHNVK